MSHVMELRLKWVSEYQARLDEISFPYQMSYIRWAGPRRQCQRLGAQVEVLAWELVALTIEVLHTSDSAAMDIRPE